MPDKEKPMTRKEKNMARDKTFNDLLYLKGAVNEEGEFITDVEFKRNPVLDRVWVPNIGKHGTSISTDVIIANTMEELLGSRALYIVWVRKVVDYVAKRSNVNDKKGIAGLSRIVQREAIAYIRDYNKRVVND